MGNNDDICSAMASSGTNKTISFNKGYFSFAFGDEIALCTNRSYYTLNCTSDLFDEVAKKVEEFDKDFNKLASWWISIENDYEVNDYSESFDDLKKLVSN